MEKKSTVFKILKIVFKILKIAIITVTIGVILFLLIQKISDNEKSIFGYRIFEIQTESMEPLYKRGDIVLVKEIQPNNICIGDSIVYYGEAENEKIVLVYSVSEIISYENNELGFKTKSLTNDDENPIVGQDKIYGKIVKKDGVITILNKIVCNRFGLYFLVLLPIISYIFLKFLKFQEKRLRSNEKLNDKNKEDIKKKD